jgi:hypothetical protein
LLSFCEDSENGGAAQIPARQLVDHTRNKRSSNPFMGHAVMEQQTKLEYNIESRVYVTYV